MPSLISIARTYRDRGLALDEVIRAGLLGLTYAMERFQPGRIFSFGFCAEWWIRQAIIRELSRSESP